LFASQASTTAAGIARQLGFSAPRVDSPVWLEFEAMSAQLGATTVLPSAVAAVAISSSQVQTRARPLPTS